MKTKTFWYCCRRAAWDTLDPYLFIIYLYYVRQTSVDLMKESGFTLAKERNRRYPARTITDADYTDDIALLTSIPTQAESLPHSLKQASGSIGLHVNADKTEFMYFIQRGNISTINSRSLKLVDKFTYPRSSVSSTKKDINLGLEKAWTAIDRL